MTENRTIYINLCPSNIIKTIIDLNTFRSGGNNLTLNIMVTRPFALNGLPLVGMSFGIIFYSKLHWAPGSLYRVSCAQSSVNTMKLLDADQG